MIRPLLLAALLALSGCGGASLGPLLDPAQAQRRGAVEIAVKGAFPGILDEIDVGAGPSLSRAFDAAGVPPQDRAARVIQLQGDLGLYVANPGALAAALLLYGA